MSTNSMKTKITKLLRKAESVDGTPEADVLREKAFALMAKYGVEQSQIDTNEATEMQTVEVNLTGAYTDCQGILLNSIAEILHCSPVAMTRPRSSKIDSMVIFGKKHHMDRVMMLFNILRPLMITGANKAYDAEPTYVRSSVIFKRSWMRGFAQRIGERLQEIENEHAADHGKGGKSGEVVLLSDLEQAMAARAEQYPFLGHKVSRTAVHGGAASSGQDAANNTDLGQTRVSNRRELTA